MKYLFILVVLGIAAFLCLSSCGDGRVAGPLSPPVSVTFRKSYIGIGIVMVVQNQSNEVLYDLKATVYHDGGKTTTEVAITDTLKPADTKEVGWMQMGGDYLAVGEDVSIYAKGYPAPYKTYCNGKAP